MPNYKLDCNDIIIRKAQLPGKVFAQFCRAIPSLLSGESIGIMSSTTQKALDLIYQWEKFAKDCPYKDIIVKANIYYKNWEIKDRKKQWVKFCPACGKKAKVKE